MFKKERDLVERSKTLLKNKEIRNFKADIKKQFPTLPEEILDQVIPNKADVALVKLANRTLLYSIEDVVYFYDHQGRNQLYPTLHMLWKYPAMIRLVYTYGPVSRFVLKGADFMTPGIARFDNLEGLQVGEKCAIAIIGNPLPFAVGESLIDDTCLLTAEGRKQKGKAVAVMHSYGDLLVSTKLVPNDGFSAEEIFATEALSEEVKRIMNGDDDDDEEDEEGSVEGGVGEEGEPDAEVDSAAEQVEQQLHIEPQQRQQSAEAEAGEEEQDDEEEDDIPVEQRDAELMEALILAFKYIVKEKQLPILVSTFWSTLQRCAFVVHDGRLVDMKRTSYRKISKFLDHCEKGLDLLKFKEDNGIATITVVKRNHDLFREYKVDDADVFKEQVKDDKQSNKTATNTNGKITVVDLYKMPKNMKDVFGHVRGEFAEHLKASEVRDLLVMYMKSHNLESTMQRSMLLIRPLDDIFALIRSSIKTPPPVVESVAKPAAATVSKPVVQQEEYEEEYEEEMPALGTGLSNIVAGVVVGGPWSSNVTMKIHKDGLKDVNSTDFPPPPPVNSASRIKGSASVGGWGLEAGKVWKPITLPPAQPKASKPVATSNKPPASAPPSYANAAGGAKAKKDKAKAESQQSEDSQVGIELTKEEFMKIILSKMTSYHAIVQSDGTTSIHSGHVPKVKVVVETRMGNKTVTLVRGLAEYDIDLTQLAKSCQKKFACSVSVSAISGIPKEKEIVLQGNYGFEMEAFLIEHCGVPRHVVEVTSGKGVKMKKK